MTNDRNVFNDFLDLLDYSTTSILAGTSPTSTHPSAVAPALPELPPAPEVLEDDLDVFLGLDHTPLHPNPLFPTGIPGGTPTGVVLAHLQRLFPELLFPDSAGHPPTPEAFSDGVINNINLGPATQAAMLSSSPASGLGSGPVSTRSSVPDAPRSSAATPGIIEPAVITLISKNELEQIRAHNRILRSNNVSIFQQRNELEMRAVAAERELAVERERRKDTEEAVRQGDETVVALLRELKELRERAKAVEEQKQH